MSSRDLKRLNRELCQAALDGDAERVRSLLDSGARAEVVFDPEEARRRHETASAMLCDEVALDSTEKAVFDSLSPGLFDHEIPLHCASRAGSVECVRLLLDAGADVAQRADMSRTAVFVGATPEVLRLLVERGLSLEGLR